VGHHWNYSEYYAVERETIVGIAAL
jgi:hypothetical protein